MHYGNQLFHDCCNDEVSISHGSGEYLYRNLDIKRYIVESGLVGTVIRLTFAKNYDFRSSTATPFFEIDTTSFQDRFFYL